MARNDSGNATLRMEGAGALLDGSLTIDIAERYTLDNIETAHEALESRRQLGKSVLMIA